MSGMLAGTCIVFTEIWIEEGVMQHGYALNGYENFSMLLRRLAIFLLLVGVTGSSWATYHASIATISSPSTTYTSPADIPINYAVNLGENDLQRVELKNETGSVLQTQYSSTGKFTVTGVTSNHTYWVNAVVTGGLDGLTHNAASAQLTMTVTAPVYQAQSINFTAPAQATYGVGSVTLSATASSGLAVSYSSNAPGVCGISGANATILAAGTCSITATQGGNTQYSAATAVTQSFTIAKANQSISFNAPSAQAYGVGSVNLSGSASSALAVAYGSTTPAVCTVSGSTASIVGVGTCSITASQGGNANYNAAASVVRTFSVSRANQSISMNSIGAKPLGTAPFSVAATATSGLTVNFGSSTPGVCTVSGSTVTLVGYGTCTLTADQAGNANYYPAPQATQSFSVSYAAQTITFSALATQTYGAGPFNVSASASSGLAVTFSTQTPSVCAVSGSTVSLLSGGSCRIAADQSGSGYYAAAPQVTQTFTVLKAAQSINFAALPVQSLGNPSFTVSATATSGLPVTFGSTTPSVCTVSGATVSLLATGTCSIAANQAGNVSYASAAQVLQSATVVAAGTPGNGATFVSQAIPSTLRAGQPYNIQVTMNNSGSTTWTEAAKFRLGAQNPQDTRAWTIAGRGLLPAGASVTTGQNVTFTIPITAPTTPGTYNLQWKMVQDGVEWFGPVTTNVSVTVTANTGPGAKLSVTPTNARMNGATPVTLTFAGNGAEVGRTISKLELFQGTGLATGYIATPIKTVTGAGSSLAMNYTASVTAGDYWYKLRATDDLGVQTDSAPVIVNVTNSSLLGSITGVRIDGSNKPQLVGWVCQPGVSQALNYQVFLDAPTAQTGGQPLVSGTAALTTEPDNAAIQSQCGTPGVGHHFNVDLSAYTAQFAGRALYVQGTAYSGGGTVVLPCADNSCTMPGTMRIGLSTPANGDQFAGPATVFMRAQISGATGPFDEVAFSVDGGNWITGTADNAAGAYYANSASLAARALPYSVQARVRQGNTTLYTVQNMITVGASSSVTVQQTSPASGSNFNPGSPITLSAMATGSAVQSVQFYANGTLVGAGTNSGGTWTYSWNTNVVGAYSLTAQAFDGAGHVLSTSPAVNITVGAGGTASSSAPLPVILSVPHLGNKDAGTLPGGLGVDANGAATYSIAIVVPPGTGGMQPNLALNYSSSGTNGVAGLGWSLSGLSSIHRCGKTIAQDGVNRSISFDLTDRLCLDGQRLVRVNAPAPADGTAAAADSAYWAANGEYRTEIESFVRVTVSGSLTVAGISVPQAFKVESRDGKVKYYGCDLAGTSGCGAGNSANSLVMATNGSIFMPSALNGAADTSKVGMPVSWALSAIVDSASNHIDFDYYTPNAATGEYLLKQIRYGGNFAAGQSAYAAVRFAYEARPDAWTRYIGDVHNDQRNRLMTIQTYVGTAGAIDDNGGTLVREYTLGYELSLSSGRSMLNSVQVCATSSTIAATGQTAQLTCLPHTTFAWGKPRSVPAGFVSVNPGRSWGGGGAGDCAQGGANAGPCLLTHGLINVSQHPTASRTHSDYFDFNDFENNGRADVLEKRVADMSNGYLSATQSPSLTSADLYSNPQYQHGTLRKQYRYFHNSGSGFVPYTYTLSSGDYFAVLSVSDFNGDGYPDLLVLTDPGSDQAGGTGVGTPKVCLSPLAQGVPAGGNIVFNCTGAIAAIGNNAGQSAPTVVDVVGDGRGAIYGPTTWTGDMTTSYATLCIQGTCLPNQTNLPSVLANKNIPALYMDSIGLGLTHSSYEQMVDFSGTGKPELVQWTVPTPIPNCTGPDCKCPQQNPDCYTWADAIPTVRVNAFAAPGALPPASLGYAHVITTPDGGGGYPPYGFGSPMNMGSLAADFNGAGYSGLVYILGINGKPAGSTNIVTLQNQFVQCLSTGKHLDCTIRKALTYDAAVTGSRAYRALAAADFDGDGQPDVLMIETDTKGAAIGDQLQLCHLTGDDTTGGAGTGDANVKCAAWSTPGITPAQLRAALNVTSPIAPLDQLYVMDLLGSGRPQLVYYHAGSFTCDCDTAQWIEDGRWEVFAPVDLALPDQALDRIYAVTDGLGSTSSVSYVDGMATGTVANSGTATLAYPQRLSPRTGKIVGKLTVGIGGEHKRTTEYRYLDAATDLAGRGSLGFGIVKAFDPDTHMRTTTSYRQAWPYSGMVASVKVTHGGQSIADSAGALISSTVNTPVSVSVAQANGASIVCPLIDNSSVDRWDLHDSQALQGRQTGLQPLVYLGNSTTVNQYTDGWCNVTRQTVTLTPPDGGAPFVTQTDTTYQNDGKAWLVGLPTLVTVRKTDPVSGSQTRTMAYSYDQVPGMLHTETAEPGDAQYQLITTYDRSTNKYGLVGKTTQAWQDPACVGNTVTPACVAGKSRTVSEVSYDALGRYPSLVKNALGHTEQHQYDGASGAQVKLTGPNGLATQWIVDGYGRVTRELRADGNETRSYLKLCQGDCPVGHVVRITDSFHGNDRIAAPQLVYSDEVGHVLRTMSWGYDGRQVVTDQRYDQLGRLWETDRPRFDSDAAHLANRQLYDDLNRVTAVETIDEAGATLRTTTAYHGLVTVLTNAANITRTETRNVAGQLTQVQAQDKVTNLTQFGYEPFGGLSKTTDPNGNVITVEYDRLGRKTALRDPDLGYIAYAVDPLGQTWKQVSPKQRAAGQASYMVYDLLGRMTARYEPDLESHWVFDQASKGVGQLNEAYTIAGGLKTYDRTHSFDAMGRPSQTSQSLSDGAYTSLTSYDIWGRVITQTYQRKSDAAKVYDTRYNNYGYLARVERGALVLWKANVRDAAGRARSVALGNGLTDTAHYDDNTGRLDTATLTTATAAQQLLQSYQYDALGNVSNRTQYWGAGAGQQGYSEDFKYDVVNRLWISQIQGQAEQTFLYDAAGNIVSKTGTGTGAYVYPPQGANAVQPHAVQSIVGVSGTFGYDANGNQTSAPGRTATWTSFDMPLRLAKGGVTSDFAYGPEHQRTRQDRSDGSVVVYAGAQEVETKGGQVTVKTYWPMGIGVEIEHQSTTTALNWVHHDNLGSPIAITDQSGALVESLAYDVWGKRRALTTNATPDALDGVVDNKGYTGHEMLDQLDLVHMNGRVYDPYTAKFLSGDPFVQDPTNGQNYSRYSYVLNNPTNLSDPTGFFSTCAQSGGSSSEIMHCAEGWTTVWGSGGAPVATNQAAGVAQGASVSFNASGFMHFNAKGEGLNDCSTSCPVEYVLPPEGWERPGLRDQRSIREFVRNLIMPEARQAVRQGIVDYNRRRAYRANYQFHHPDSGRVTSQVPDALLFLLTGPAGTAERMAAESAAKIAVADGRFYSVAFETKLSTDSYPGFTRYMHFKEANGALEEALAANPALANMGITVPRSATGAILGKSPEGWVWHHDLEPGVMQLVPKSQHPNVPGGIFWETLHPGGYGGYSMWGK